MIPSIQVLRAIAVVAVVLYHLKPTFFPGGYRGVDLFFVISGYVIARSVFRSQEAGKFTISSFYWKRVWRILPALSLMLLLCSVWTVLFTSPSQFEAIFNSLPFAAFQIANFHFLVDGSYFDLGHMNNPLLHCWSLGVEEQFFIFFPIIVALVSRPASLRKALFAATVTSLVGYSVAVINQYGDRAFFMFDTRAWQFGFGILGYMYFGRAIESLKSAERWEKFRTKIASLSLCLLLVMLWQSGAQDGTTGLFQTTLFTIAALTLLISGLPIRFSGRIFAPLIYVGSISYSLYLWHWPVIIFSRLLGVDASHSIITLGLILILSVLSYHLIEVPCRSLGDTISKKRDLSNALWMKHSYPLWSVLLLGLAFICINGGAYAPWRIVTKEANIEQETKQWEVKLREKAVSNSDFVDSNWLKQAKSDKPVYLLVGDSHAIALAGAFTEYCYEKGAEPMLFVGYFYPFAERVFYFQKKSGGTIVFDHIRQQACLRRLISDESSIQKIVVAWRAGAFSSKGLTTDPYTHASITKASYGLENDLELSRNTIRSDLEKFSKIATESGKDLVFVSQPPPLSSFPVQNGARVAIGTQLIERYFHFGTVEFVRDYQERLAFERKLLSELEIKHGGKISVVDSQAIITSPYLEGELLYYDDDHLAINGARLLIREIK